MFEANAMIDEIPTTVLEIPDEDKWIVDVTERITDTTVKNCKQDLGHPVVTINRVPKFLSFLRKESYTPRVVHLGLFHHRIGQPLSHMERLKAEAVERMADRLHKQEAHLHLKEAIRGLVCEIRGCYEEESVYKDETVAMILTLDGCFVLEILRVLSAEQQQQRQGGQNSHPIFNTTRIKSCQFDLLCDFLMLENQIPIMVLIKLLEVETGSESEAKKQLLRLLCSSIIPEIHPFLPNWLDRANLLESRLKGYEDLESYKHILGLLQSLIAADPRDIEETAPVERSRFRLAIQGLLGKLRIRQKAMEHHQTLMASARDLHKAGIKFRQYYGIPSQGGMTFRRTTLLLPTIWITDSTEVILRNLMVLEVCQGSALTVISYYVHLLNGLVETEADVAILRRAGIIQSSMGTDKEVSYMLNNLGKGINFNSSDDPFMNLKVEINHWYRGNFQIQIREYKDKHPRLWRNFSIFWGLALLVSAAIPTLVKIWEKIK
ncbi:hypothetical protein SUGI_1089780 [Cryptomeria japonica]|uniref:putative UPF0481 protein At3g02645 n=1 Tax=Cryptomeria japonica TaxID=3369 RepID=UPI002414BD28|nr:putative UPF0481 protein At3g02645 [Cryptomeria japonica]GLJ51225.1 hypothetical protein SUGI_1089780 [Cryptomeria japonica]